MKPGKPARTRHLGHFVDFLQDNLLVLLTILGVIIGVIIGLSVRQTQPSQDVIIWIGLAGESYMRMIKMMILPLVICSVISGSASLDPKCNGRVSVISLTYIMLSNSLCCVMPMIVALILKPGQGVNLHVGDIPPKKHDVMDTLDIFADLIRNIFPDNIITACFQQAQTKYQIYDFTAQQNTTSGVGDNLTWSVTNVTLLSRIKAVGSAPSTNVLGLVICSFVFGMATASIGTSGQPFLAFFTAANEVVMKVLRWFVWTTPIGVMSLIAVALLQTADLESAGKSLAMFSLAVLLSLAIHQFLIVPLVYLALVRQNPYRFLLTLGRPWMVSFAAASSAVAIPETLNALEHSSNIDKRITRFVVPFASTMNRDGTCIFITISCMFVGQAVDADLHAGRLVFLWILTTLVSVAVPSVPSAGIVAVIINLTALGIPAELVGLLFTTEWLLDRFRSASNMLSHAHCAMLTFRFCKSYLPAVGEPQEDFDLEVVEPMMGVGNGTKEGRGGELNGSSIKERELKINGEV